MFSAAKSECEKSDQIGEHKKTWERRERAIYIYKVVISSSSSYFCLVEKVSFNPNKFDEEKILLLLLLLLFAGWATISFCLRMFIFVLP